MRTEARVTLGRSSICRALLRSAIDIVGPQGDVTCIDIGLSNASNGRTDHFGWDHPSTINRSTVLKSPGTNDAMDVDDTCPAPAFSTIIQNS